MGVASADSGQAGRDVGAVADPEQVHGQDGEQQEHQRDQAEDVDDRLAAWPTHVCLAYSCSRGSQQGLQL